MHKFKGASAVEYVKRAGISLLTDVVAQSVDWLLPTVDCLAVFRGAAQIFG